MDNTSTSTSSFQNIARPPTRLLPSPVQLTTTTPYKPCIFQNLFISKSFFLVSERNTQVGFLSRKSFLKVQTIRGFPRPRQFQDMQLIVSNSPQKLVIEREKVLLIKRENQYSLLKGKNKAISL
ncbi:hypothetical protein MTR_7g027100 [Medicago truncatula]|uniref:Uncharacterized protein n=1 Tax=Medicago truncatula TaxID=3880 RepID=G7L157_MEDTR|nr:hypothetical protein MTR_7g027100 [Medicago truncatula]